MRIKAVPEDFVVEELLRLRPTSQGTHTLYRVRKVGITTLELKRRMAAILRCSPQAIHFPALKDRVAIAWQHATVAGTERPERIEGKGFRAIRLGLLGRHLTPADLLGNRFTVVVREIPQEISEQLDRRIDALLRHGYPNYFDEQRFGSLPSDGSPSIGKWIAKRDAERALQTYLTIPFRGDPPSVRQFKEKAAAHWKDWDMLFRLAPRPSNYRSVLTYLRDHPQGFRKALQLIPHRLLSIYLSAYQSLLWNRIVSYYLAETVPGPHIELVIGSESVIVPTDLSEGDVSRLRSTKVPLPHHKAIFPDERWQQVVSRVLEEEELSLADLKARILQKAYYSRSSRSIWIVPSELAISSLEKDSSDTVQAIFRFVLPPGSYATLLLQVLLEGG